MDNYKLAQEEFITSYVDENLICLDGNESIKVEAMTSRTINYMRI